MSQEIDLKSQSNSQLAGLLCEEGLKWYQILKAQFLLEEDSSTRFFYRVANGRHMNELINSLIQEDANIQNTNNSNHILQSIIKVCSETQRKVISLWMKPGLITYLRYSTRKPL
jgi:hypothetical protein